MSDKGRMKKILEECKRRPETNGMKKKLPRPYGFDSG